MTEDGASDRIRDTLESHLPVSPADTATYPYDERHNLSRAEYLNPSYIAQFFTLEKCPQFFKYQFDEDVATKEKQRKDYREAFEPLSGLLAKEGNDFEANIVRSVSSSVSDDHFADLEGDDDLSVSESPEMAAADAEAVTKENDVTPPNNQEVIDAIVAAYNDPGTPAILSQASFRGFIEAWPVSGDADLVYVWYHPDEKKFRIRVGDIKAAHEEKPYQQIQVAIYTILLKKFLSIAWGDLSDEYDYTVEGCIFFRDSDSFIGDPDELPEFDLWPREQDVRHLLQPGGLFDQIDSTDESEIDYQLDSKCYGCAFREACYTNAIEEQSTALLGLTRSQQQVLRDRFDIETVYDIARLAYLPDEDTAKPHKYDALRFKGHHQETVEKLRQTGIGTRLSEIVQRAQSLVHYVDPDHSGFNPDGVPWLIGSGYGDLPEDDPAPAFDTPDDHEEEPKELAEREMNRPSRGEMIRVYLHVQEDHRNDTVSMVSGYVTASQYLDDGNSPIPFCELVESVPEDREGVLDEEQSILSQTAKSLRDAITEVNNAMGRNQTFVHFYTYTPDEKTALLDALTRHSPDDTSGVLTTAEERIQSFRDLLLLTGGVNREEQDQPMFSVVQSEVQTRVALPVPNPGLLPVMDMLPAGYHDAFHVNNWEYTPNGESDSIDLRTAFRYRMFDYGVPYTTNGGALELHPGGNSEFDGYFPSRVRPNSQIPLEYIWYAVGRIDDKWIQEVEEVGSGQPVSGFKYHDLSVKDRTISREDVKELGKRLAHGVASVERALNIRQSDFEKSPIDPNDISGGFTQGETNLARSLREFLDLEHEASRSDLHNHYSLPVEERVRTGKSIPVAICEEPEQLSSNEYRFTALPAYEAFFDDAEEVQNRCRLKDEVNDTSGSWMLATEIDTDANPIHYQDSKRSEDMRPEDIERNVPVTIEEIDWDAGPQNRGRISFKHLNVYPGGGTDYLHSFRTATLDKADESFRNQHFEYKKYFVLDPQADDLNMQKAQDMLESAPFNPLYRIMDGMVSGTNLSPTTPLFTDSHINESVSWMNDYFGRDDTDGNPPNNRQTDFIEKHESQVSLLQGPPGTGKTSGALSKALHSRLLSFDRDTLPSATLVSGKSHTSVDEVMEDTAEIISEYHADPDTDGLENVKLVRIGGAGPTPDADDAEMLNNMVDYVQRHSGNPDDEDQLHETFSRLHAASKRSSLGSGNTSHVVIFTTPGQFHGFMNDFSRYLYEEDAPRPEEMVEMDGHRYFDLLAVDESSMMSIPEFLITGAFLRDTAQVMVCGDQRQMPPIVQHEWDDEHRWTVAEMAPHLSVLNYFRFLRGDEIEGLDEDMVVSPPGADIDMTKLRYTYRCHPVIANFLDKYHYAKDQINYESKVEFQMDDPEIDDLGTGIGAALNPDKPLVLIKHDDVQSQQMNRSEAAITAALMEGVNPSQRDEVGVVTPHNAQKAFVNMNTPDGVEVDTVERYQGGERSIIAVSATASDPDFIKSEQDFLLNPNRLNVAMSRMKQKLFVIVSESVFEMVPNDLDTYNESLLWKGLFREMDALDRDPDWNGSLEDFMADVDTDFWFDDDVNVDVFTLPQDN